MSNPSQPPQFQFSLRWLLVAVTLVAIVLGMSGFVHGGFSRILGLLLFVVLPTPLVIIVVYGRGDPRAFAIGASIPCAATWAGAANFVTPIGDAIWFLLLVAVCGAIAVATRRWVERNAAHN